jgi:hypothetical protein
MAKRFSVLDISWLSKNDNLLHVKISVDGEEREFDMVFKELGAAVPAELDHLIMNYLEKMQEFIVLLVDWHEGVPIKFPVDFRCWERPAEDTLKKED